MKEQRIMRDRIRPATAIVIASLFGGCATPESYQSSSNHPTSNFQNDPTIQIALDKAELCQSMGNVAYSAASERDAGTPRSELHAKVRRLPESREAKEALHDIVDGVYDTPYKNPTELRAGLTAHCIERI